MAYKNPKPLMKITPKNLIALRQGYYLGQDNSVCRILCHLIDSIAEDKGWDLNDVVWTHTDGRRFKGLEEQERPKTLEQIKAEGHPKDYSVVAYFHRADFILVVLRKDDLELNETPTYRCMRYIHVNNSTGWKLKVDYRDTSCEIALTWFSKEVKKI